MQTRVNTSKTFLPGQDSESHREARLIFPSSSQVRSGGRQMKLTRAAVQTLQLAPDKSELIVFDDEIPGFGVRLRAGGSRNWIVQYKVGRKHRRLTFGSVAVLEASKARERARDLLAAVRIGRDPAGEKIENRSRADETVGVIVERFMARQRGRLRSRTYTETKRYLQTHWKPLHGLALARVNRTTVAARLAWIAGERGPSAADRARAALSAFFTWAIREGLADVNPVGATNTASTASPVTAFSPMASSRPSGKHCSGILMVTSCVF